MDGPEPTLLPLLLHRLNKIQIPNFSRCMNSTIRILLLSYTESHYYYLFKSHSPIIFHILNCKHHDSIHAHPPTNAYYHLVLSVYNEPTKRHCTSERTTLPSLPPLPPTKEKNIHNSWEKKYTTNLRSILIDIDLVGRKLMTYYKGV